MSVFLGVDVGTYETKAVLVDASGAVLATAAHGHEMLVPRAGWAEHRAEEDWWAGFVHVTRAVLNESGVPPGDVAGVACSAIGPCMLPVDAGGRALTNAVLYGVDTRASAEVTELTGRIGDETLLYRCGNLLTSQSVGPKILWLARNRPEVFAAADGIATSTTYLVERLTGERVIDHYSAAGFTPLYDVRTQDWAEDLAEGIVETRRLPRLLWSGEVAGGLTQAAAQETGLASGTPVTAGTIDAAAEALSVGVRHPGDMMVMYGSTIFVIALAESAVRDRRLWSAPWLFRGEHAAMAGQATSGTLTHWFRDRFARELPGEDAFAALAEEAAATPRGAEGLLCLPYFSGERTPIHDPAARGAFFGLNLTHKRGHMMRALLEGIAFGTNHIVEAFAEASEPPRRILAVGGGTKNRVWLQATSDISGLEQVLPRTTLGASFGDAFLAAFAVGAVERQDITKWNPEVDRVTAEPAEVYAHQYALWRRLYEQTKDIAHGLS